MIQWREYWVGKKQPWLIWIARMSCNYLYLCGRLLYVLSCQIANHRVCDLLQRYIDHREFVLFPSLIEKQIILLTNSLYLQSSKILSSKRLLQNRQRIIFIQNQSFKSFLLSFLIHKAFQLQKQILIHCIVIFYYCQDMSLIPLTITPFAIHDADINYDDVLIRMFLEQQQENSKIDLEREQAALISRQLSESKEENNSRWEMKEIGQKLNKLQRSLMRDRDLTTAKICNSHGAVINNKYEELSTINSNINSILRNLSQSGKAKPVLDSIKKKLITMYNQSVQQLALKDKLNKKIQCLKEKQTSCQKAISQVRMDIQNFNSQLTQVKALRAMNFRKWKRIEQNFTKIY